VPAAAWLALRYAFRRGLGASVFLREHLRTMLVAAFFVAAAVLVAAGRESGLLVPAGLAFVLGVGLVVGVLDRHDF
jgi:hypothetical protein